MSSPGSLLIFWDFSRGEKVVKFDFSFSKLRKQPFFVENFKIQGSNAPLPPLPTPMCMV